MYAFVVLVALACAAQVTYGRPDFGIQGTVPGKDSVIKWAIVTKGFFLRINDYIVPDLKNDIDKLSDVVMILSSIGHQMNNLGPVLMDTIATVTEDNSGHIQTAYALVNYARIMFEGYIVNELQVQINSIETLVGHHLRDQLVDDFFHIQTQMDAVSATLATLQAAVEDAQAAAGGGIVSDALVRQFIDDDLVAQLSRDLALLAYRIPVLTYTLTSSLENVQQADDYLYGLMLDRMREWEAVGDAGSDFNDNAIAYSSAGAEAAMDALIDWFAVDLSSAVETAATLDVPDLTAAVAALADVQGSGLPATLQEYVDLYTVKVHDLSVLLPLESSYSFGENENPFVVLTDVLIANGPWSRFCFWKYSGVLHNQMLVANYASECYERELDRLQTLQQALLVQLDLIAYDLEIVDPYTMACTFLPASAGDRIAECAQELADYFLLIADVYDSKLSAFVRLAEIELAACEVRLSVCWSTRVHQSFVHYENTASDAIACSVSGPLA